ncbi:hypothetical protein LMG33810_002158 [Carnimonas sp. LMG 33810]
MSQPHSMTENYYMKHALAVASLVAASLTAGSALAAPAEHAHSATAPTAASAQSFLHQRYQPLLESWNLSSDQQSAVWKAEQHFFQSLPKHQRPARGEKPTPPTAEQRAAFKKALDTRHAELAKVLNGKQLAAWEAVTKPPMGPRHHPMMHKRG